MQVPMGQKATFFVEVEGDNISYQWQYKPAIQGATWTNATRTEGIGFNTNTFTTAPVTDSHSGWEYRCIVRGNDGYYYEDQNAIISDSATLNVTKDGYSKVVYINESYKIKKDPENVLTFPGEKATFKVVATGNSTLTYRWLYKNSDENSAWTEVPESMASGTKTDTLVINKVLEDYSGYMFRCSVGGSVYVYEKSLLSNVAYLFTIEPNQIIKVRLDAITYTYEDGTKYNSEWTNKNIIATVPLTTEDTTWISIKKGSGEWSVEQPEYAKIEKTGNSEIKVTFDKSINDEIYIMRVDTSGNPTTDDIDNKVIKIDKEVPKIEDFVCKNENKEYILSVKISDEVSGIMGYAIALQDEEIEWITPENQYEENIEHTLEGSGVYYLYVKDNAENEKNEYIKIIRDLDPPKGNITIKEKYFQEGKTEYTNQNIVTLQITASDNVTSTENLQMALYEESEYKNLKTKEDIVWEKYVPEKEWELKNETEKIYLILKDEAGNISAKID